MQNIPTVITATGFGATGSSAVIDILAEVSDLQAYRNDEIRFLYDPKGVLNLHMGLTFLNNRQNSDFYIKEFLEYIKFINEDFFHPSYRIIFDREFKNLSEKYVERLIESKWQACIHWDIERASMLKKALYFMNKAFLKFILRKRETAPNILRYPFYYADILTNDFFLKETEAYLIELFRIASRGKHNLVLDQLLPPTNSDLFLRYYKNLKVIYVERDPRDLYVLQKVIYKEPWIPFHDVDLFIRWYRKTRSSFKLNESFTIIYFEDLIFNYPSSVQKIFDFCNLDAQNWINKQKFFNPEKSKLNTGVYKNTFGLDCDIKKIEIQLSEFLYGD